MSSLDLFAYADEFPRNFRASDPITSKESGRAAQKFISGDQAEILKALRRRPMAAEEISDFLGWNDSVRVCRRLADMIRAELIERTADKHTNRNGRGALRHRLKQQSSGAERPTESRL